jgi:N-acyl homoserine lactone hydrolase
MIDLYSRLNEADQEAHMTTWKAILGSFLLAAGLLAGCAPDDPDVRPPEAIRLYVLDGGVLASDPTRYDLKVADVGETSLSVAAYLVVHPQGVLLWDAGAIADAERIPDGTGLEQRVVRTDGQERFVTLGAPLMDQIAAAGFSPAEITYLALSHYHWDHTANANEFASAVWLTTEVERERMFSDDLPGGTRPTTYSALRNSRVNVIDEAEYDVFGDGTVIIKQAPGHTEGHCVLYVKLARTGGVVLSGDLYHYPAERALGRVPDFEVNTDQTRASRAAIEDFLSRTGAELWIQHDLVHHRRLNAAPEYYE